MSREFRQEIADVVGAHLDEIMDEIMQTYRAEIHTVRDADPPRLLVVRAALDRALQVFLYAYSQPDSLMRPMLEQARSATIRRAGEVFEREDIVQMIRLGRHVMVRRARALIDADPDFGAADQEALESELDAFLNELERAETGATEMTPDILTRWLRETERDEPDLG